MKVRIFLSSVIILVLFAGLFGGGRAQAEPVGTAFTYQGRLIDANTAADGPYDFRFRLFDSNTDGNQLGSSIYKPDVDVIDGYFTAEVDFGLDILFRDKRWLQIEVRDGELEDPNVYTLLSPRQLLSAAPYSLNTRGLDIDKYGNLSCVAGGAADIMAGTSMNLDCGTLMSLYAGSGMEVLSDAYYIMESGFYIDCTAATDVTVTAGQNMDLESGGAMSLVSSNMVINSPLVSINGTVSVNDELGIGTGTPRGPLDVRGEGDNLYIDTYSSTISIGDTEGNGNETVFAVNDVGGEFLFKNGDVGIGTDAPARKLHISDVMRLQPIGGPPIKPAEGDIYMDGVLHKLMVYDGTKWQACW